MNMCIVYSVCRGLNVFSLFKCVFILPCFSKCLEFFKCCFDCSELVAEMLMYRPPAWLQGEIRIRNTSRTCSGLSVSESDCTATG